MLHADAAAQPVQKGMSSSSELSATALVFCFFCFFCAPVELPPKEEEEEEEEGRLEPAKVPPKCVAFWGSLPSRRGIRPLPLPMSPSLSLSLSSSLSDKKAL